MKLKNISPNMTLRDVSIKIDNVACHVCNDILYDWEVDKGDFSNYIVLKNTCCGKHFEMHLQLLRVVIK